LYSTLLGEATFHDLLLACDEDLTNEARRQRCLICQSALHSPDYPRKPRGRLCRLGPEMKGCCRPRCSSALLAARPSGCMRAALSVTIDRKASAGFLTALANPQKTRV
jgi:hypothetical protein